MSTPILAHTKAQLVEQCMAIAGRDGGQDLRRRLEKMSIDTLSCYFNSLLDQSISPSDYMKTPTLPNSPPPEEISARLRAENQAVEALVAYSTQRKPLETTSCAIMTSGKFAAWVSGLPYMFSAFRERAFVFASIDDAKAFVEAHKPLLKEPITFVPSR